MRLTLTLLFLSCFFCSYAQEEIILKNPSFEGFPKLSRTPDLWFDCGFPGESQVDIHPVPNSEFQVDKTPIDGDSYLGMITRENETWEAIGQRLSQPLQGGKTYGFSIYLSRSATYISALQYSPKGKLNFATPIKLRIWGGDGYCKKAELLAESPIIINTRWLEFDFKLNPSNDLSYITFEAFYKVPCPFPYNGNILLDNASSIVELGDTEFLFADSVRVAYLDSLEDAEIFVTPAAEEYLKKKIQPKTEVQLAEEEEFKEGVLTKEDRTFLREQLKLVKFEPKSPYLKNEGIDAVIEIVKKLNKFEEDLKISFCINTVESGWKSKRGKEILSLFLEAGIPKNNIRLRKYIPDIKEVYFRGGGYSDIYLCIY
jgi:hypothetical protein